MNQSTLLNYIRKNNYNVYLSNGSTQIFIVNEDSKKDYVAVYSIMNGEKSIDDIMRTDIIGNLEYIYFDDDLTNISNISNEVNLDLWYGNTGVTV